MSLLDSVAIDSLLHEGHAPPDKLFSSKRLESLPAQPLLNTRVIEFDTLPTTSKWCLWHEGWIQIPLAIAPTAAAPANVFSSDDPLVAFKGSALSLFNGVSVRTGDGRVIFEDRDSGVFANHLRLMLETHSDWFVSNGEDVMWAKDRPEPGVVSGLTSKANIQPPQSQRYAGAAPATVDNTKPEIDKALSLTMNADNPARNLGFLERRKMLLDSADGSGGSHDANGITTTLNIPLRYIHTFFEAMDFPIINSRMMFIFYLNTDGGSSYQPMCLGKDLTGTVETGGGLSLTIPAGKLPRLYYHAVSFQGDDAERVAGQLKEGFNKTIRFKTYDMKREINRNGSLSSYQYQVSNNVVDPLRLYALCYPTGVVDSNTWPNPIMTGNDVGIRNISVLINNELYTANRIDSFQDQYSLLKECLPLNPDLGASSTLSYSEWLKTFRIVCIDLQRRGDLSSKYRGVPTTLQIEATPLDATGMDTIYLIEKEKKVQFSFGASDFDVRL